MFLSFKKILYSLVVFLAVVCLQQNLAEAQKIGDMPLEVSFLNVGQGDAILINYLNKNQILIDTGRSSGAVLEKLRKEMPPDDQRIEIIVITHPDADHIGGLGGAVDNYEVGLVLDNGFDLKRNNFEKIKEKLEEKGIERHGIFEGSELSLGRHLALKAFNPDDRNYSSSDKNGDSVVLRMDFGENSFLFTGDIDKGTERDILEDAEDADADWLKVAHHGSKNSSSARFIKEVSPQFGVISAGEDNSYGHPHEEVLDLLEKSDSKILTTAEKGTIKVGCPGLEQQCRVLE
ncbi:MAG: ComEC/Rec2 family competence protein [Candidatus Moranbacteria bacterium]|nr:ComEC/Rec2 family competence protein [Candidatus Moranbacteria bacterium]